MTNKFDHLVGLMARLRAPDGCPWDREQTHDSLKGAMFEEACEVMAEIERGNLDGLKDELGDLLLHVVFHAQIAEEAGNFTIEDVIDGVAEKLVRRHPHIFGDEQAENAEDVELTWERVKEKEGKGKIKVGDQLPTLLAARKLQSRAAGANHPLNISVDSGQLRSLIAEENNPDQAIAQLLFSVVALARNMDVEPEWALAKLLVQLQQDETT